MTEENKAIKDHLRWYVKKYARHLKEFPEECAILKEVIADLENTIDVLDYL